MSKMMQCWQRDASGSYFLIERQAPDWDHPYVPPEPDWAMRNFEERLDEFEMELYGRPLDKGDVAVPKIDERPRLLKAGN